MRPLQARRLWTRRIVINASEGTIATRSGTSARIRHWQRAAAASQVDSEKPSRKEADTESRIGGHSRANVGCHGTLNHGGDSETADEGSYYRWLVSCLQLVSEIVETRCKKEA